MYLEKNTYRNNGSIAILMYNMDDEPYGAVTVNLCHHLQSDELAFVDENNMPGIGKWLERNHLALSHSGQKILLNLCLSLKSGRHIFFDESGKLLSWNGNPENFNRPVARADFIACMVSLA